MSRKKGQLKRKPIILITMGDAAGVGPEIVAKALYVQRIYRACRPIVVGSTDALKQAMKVAGLQLELHAIESVAMAKFKYGTIDVLDLHNLDIGQVVLGEVSAAAGKAAMEFIVKAVEMLKGGEADALVTAPINKEATKLAGYEEMGHMELLARLTGTSEYATMLVSGSLRVVHLTTHYPLHLATKLVTKEGVLAKLNLTQRCFQNWGLEHLRIGVAALNPHSGEGGLLGHEEIDHIAPAVREAQNLGINASGPHPADSIFHRAIDGEFDAVLALYHDQGHIPIKVHGFEESISVALGLPFIRTSVDHGTAFDIAGKGIASHRSLVNAIEIAVRLCTGKGLS